MGASADADRHSLCIKYIPRGRQEAAGEPLGEAKMTQGTDPRSLRTKNKPPMYIEAYEIGAGCGSPQSAHTKEAPEAPGSARGVRPK